MLEIASDEDVRNILQVKQVDDKPVINPEVQKIPLINVTKLPSGFKGYPKGTTISYEPLTLGELEALNNSDEIDVERGVAMLLNSIHCNTLKPQELSYWDVMYIGIQRKLLAFGDTRGIIYAQCPNCGEIIEREFDYTELEFKEIEAEDLPVITTLQDTEVEIGLISIQDFFQLDIKKGELDVYARMIKNLPYEQSFELISKCYGKDLQKIKYIDKILNYGLKPLFEICKNKIDNPDFDSSKKQSKNNTEKILCNTNVRLEVRSPFEVVFPEDTNIGFDPSEIRFGKK